MAVFLKRKYFLLLIYVVLASYGIFQIVTAATIALFQWVIEFSIVTAANVCYVVTASSGIFHCQYSQCFIVPVSYGQYGGSTVPDDVIVVGTEVQMEFSSQAAGNNNWAVAQGVMANIRVIGEWGVNGKWTVIVVLWNFLIIVLCNFPFYLMDTSSPSKCSVNPHTQSAV